MTASVTRNTIIARQRLLSDDIHHAQGIGKSPRLSLAEPHQRSVNAKLLIQGQIECDIETLDKVVAAIGITTEIGLTYSSHQVTNSMRACIDGSYG